MSLLFYIKKNVSAYVYNDIYKLILFMGYKHQNGLKILNMVTYYKEIELWIQECLIASVSESDKTNITKDKIVESRILAEITRSIFQTVTPISLLIF